MRSLIAAAAIVVLSILAFAALAGPLPDPVPRTASAPAVSAAPLGAPAAAKPTAKPAAKPTAKPAAKPTAKPAAKPTAKPAAKPTAKPTPGLVSVPVFASAAISGATLEYFTVTGANPVLVRNSITAASPKYCGRINYAWYTGGTSPSGCDLWRARWATVTSLGVCRVTSFSMTSTVWLPSWRTSAKVAPAWPTWWRDYQKVVRDHEAGHVAITRKWEPSIESKMIGVSCPLADAAYAAASKSHDQAQEAYDKAEYPLAAARYPKWPSGYPYGSVLK